MKTSSSYIRGFDGLRAISIIFVLLNHLGIRRFLPQTSFFLDRAWLLMSGVTGVNIFFAISGYLITTLLLREKEATGRIAIGKFYARRFLRLAPPLLLFYVVIIILMLTHVLPAAPVGLVFAMAYLYNFVPNRFYTGELGHTWSLGVEEQFYLLWPILLWHFRRRRIIWIAAIIIALSVLATAVLPQLHLTLFGVATALGRAFKVERWFIPAVAPIMIGAAMALYQRSKPHAFIWSRVLPVAALLFISPLYVPAELLPFAYLTQALGIALLLAWLVHAQQSRLAAFLELAPIAFLGRISYGVYIWQGLFLRTGPGGTLPIQQFPLNIGLTLLCALTSYYTVERAATRFKKRFKAL